MKITESKSSSAASHQKAMQPFFGKRSNSFFPGESIREGSSFFNGTHSSYGLSNGGTIQTKLTIGQPNDKYEQEADHMADKVVQRLSENNSSFASDANNTIQARQENNISSLSFSPIQMKCAACEHEEKLQKKENDDNAPLEEKIQKKPIFESNAEPPDDNNIQRKCADCEQEEKLQKKEDDDKVPLEEKIQKKPIFESNAEPPDDNSIQRKCADCEYGEKIQKKEDDDKVPLEEKIQKKPIFESNAEPPDDNDIQRKSAAYDGEEKFQKKSDIGSSQTTHADIESSLSSSKGSGSTLPASIREQMESSFGSDFSAVRIHNNSTSVQMSKDLNAQAFTRGSDIYFNSGKYNTNSKEGQHLLAHELTHTIQQRGEKIPFHTDKERPEPSGNASVQKKNIRETQDINPQKAFTDSISLTSVKTTNLISRQPNIQLNAEDDQKEIEKIEKALKSEKLSDVSDIDNYKLATEEQRIDLIRIVIKKSEFAKSAALEILIVIWFSFEDRLPIVAEAHMQDWEDSIAMCPPLTSNPQVKKIQEIFVNDIKRIASDNLFANREYVLARKTTLGLSGAVGKSLTIEEKNNFRHKVQDMSYHIWELRQSQNKLKDTTIGYTTLAFAPPDPIKFNPQRKPFPEPTTLGRKLPQWDDLKEAWGTAATEIARVGGQYPEIYAALAAKDADGELLNLSRLIPEAFWSLVPSLLDGLILRIENEQIKLEHKETDPLDLYPIQDQLFQGFSNASKKKWNQGFDQWAAKRLLSDEKENQKATKEALLTLEVMALIVASFATAGSLTFFLAGAVAVGTPAVQGALDWKQAQKLDQTAKATPLQGTELVTQAQSDEKKSQAIVELVRAFINAITLGVPSAIKLARTALRVEATAAAATPRIILYRGTVYKFIKGSSGPMHDLGPGLYMTTDPDLAVIYAQERRAQIQAAIPGTPGVVLKVEVETSELGRVFDFYNDPVLKQSWESYVKGLPNGDVLLKGGVSSEIYNAYFQNWLQTRGLSLNNFDVIIGPEYRLGGPQVVISNGDTAASLLERSEEWARAHEPVIPDAQQSIQRKASVSEQEDKLQKKQDSSSLQNPSPDTEANLASSKGSGNPIPDNTRQQMESSFGADFSNVRIHHDSNSVEMSKDLNAQAFTHGSDIYFNSGKYDTNSNSGKHLLAHELTHVVQQKVVPSSIAAISRVTIKNGVLDLGIDSGQWYNENKDSLWYNILSTTDNIKIDNCCYAYWLLGRNDSFIYSTFYALSKLSWSELNAVAAPRSLEGAVKRGRDANESGRAFSGQDFNNLPSIASEVRAVFVPRVREELPRLITQFVALSYQEMKNKVEASEPGTFFSSRIKMKFDPFQISTVVMPGEYYPQIDYQRLPQRTSASPPLVPSKLIDKAIIEGLAGGQLLVNYADYLNSGAYLNASQNIKNIGANQIHFSWEAESGAFLWARILDPKNVTKEMVSNELYGDTALSNFLVDASPLFGFKPSLLTKTNFEAWKENALEVLATQTNNGKQGNWIESLISELTRFDINLGMPFTDAAAEIQNNNLIADEAALNQSKKFKATGENKDLLVAKMRNNIFLLTHIEKQANYIGIAESIGELTIKKLEERSKLLSESDDMVMVIKWDAHTEEQTSIIKRLADDFEIAVKQYDSYKGNKTELPDFIKKPFSDAVTGLAEVANIVELVDTAEQRLPLAEEQLRLFDADLLDETLRDSRKALGSGEEGDSQQEKDLGIESIRQDQENYRAALVNARELMAQDPEKAQQIISGLKQPASDLRDKANLISIMDQLQAMIDFMNHHSDTFIGTVTRKFQKYFDATQKLEAWHEELYLIYLDYDLKVTSPFDAEYKEEVLSKTRLKLQKLLQDRYSELKNLIDETSSTIESEEKKEAWISLGAKILGVIAISLVSMGVGAAAVGFSAGWAATTSGAIAAELFVVGTEATTFTLLSDKAFGSDPNKSLLRSIGENMLLFGAFKGISVIYEASFGAMIIEKWPKIGPIVSKTGDYALGLVLQIKYQLYEADKQARATTGKGLGDDEASNIVKENLVVFIATLLVSRYAKGFFEGARIRGERFFNERFSKIDLAREEAKSAALKLNDKSPVKQANDALSKDAEALQLEIDLIDELKKWAVANKDEATLAGINIDDLNKLSDTGTKQMQDRALINISVKLKAKGGSLFECEPGELDGKDGIIEGYKNAGVKDGDILPGIDPVSGAKFIDVKPPSAAESIHIVEKPRTEAQPKNLTQFELTEMFESLSSPEAREMFDDILKDQGPKRALAKFRGYKKSSEGLEGTLLNPQFTDSFKIKKAEKEESEKIDLIRKKYTISKDKNVAYAEGEIDGKPVDLSAHSGIYSKPGTVETTPFDEQQLDTHPTERDVDKGQTSPERRAFDSEAKILEYLLKNTTPNSKGNFKIVSERIICESCTDAITQFEQYRPGIKVERVSIGKL